ncbi:DUF6470 family protein [Caldicellulosiruptoraceae bacterium PP1]
MQLNILSLHTEFPKVKIQTEQLKVKINQDECWNERNLGSTAYLIESSAQRGYNAVLNFTAKTAQNGDRLSQIEKGGKPIIDICVEEAFESIDYNVDVIPKSKPVIYFEGGTVNIDFEMGSVDVRV